MAQFGNFCAALVMACRTAWSPTPRPLASGATHIEINSTEPSASGAVMLTMPAGSPRTPGSTTTFNATGGSTGIPLSASAIYANITVRTSTTADNYVIPYSTGTARPNTSLNYAGAVAGGPSISTALGTTIDLNSSGQFDLYIGASAGAGPVDVFIDVQGYFDGLPSTSGFTPVASRILDTRVSPNVAVPANSVTTVQLGGVGGIPNGSATLAGVALNVQALNSTSNSGYLRMWSGDQAEPTATSGLNFDANSFTSNLALVQPAVSNGTIKIRNISNSAVHLVLDAEGISPTRRCCPSRWARTRVPPVRWRRRR